MRKFPLLTCVVCVFFVFSCEKTKEFVPCIFLPFSLALLYVQTCYYCYYLLYFLRSCAKRKKRTTVQGGDFETFQFTSIKFNNQIWVTSNYFIFVGFTENLVHECFFNLVRPSVSKFYELFLLF